VLCTKVSAEFKFGGHSPLGVHPQKCGVQLVNTTVTGNGSSTEDIPNPHEYN